MSSRTRIGVGLLAVSAIVFSTGSATAAVSGAEPVATADVAAGRVLVKYAPGVEQSAQDALERGVGARGAGRIVQLDVRVLEVPQGTEQEVAAALTRSGQVEYAEVDGTVTGAVTPDDPSWSQQWGPQRIRLPEAWDVTRGASSVTVAVLDTGVDHAHPDLAGRLLPGYDFVNGDSDASDDHGHGTKVAGVAAAATNNGQGVAGGCWTCSVLPVKVLGSSNSGTWSGLANGITWSADRGAHVISMSLSGSSASSTVQQAVQYAQARGSVLVAAAGNTGTAEARYPAAFPEVLSVAGSTSSDSLYSWSTYGDTVDLAAPGCNRTTVLGGSYGDFCGTSSATPLVAGTLALLVAVQPAATPAELMSAVLTSAVPIPADVASGRVDGAAAVASVGTAPPADPSEPAPGTTDDTADSTTQEPSGPVTTTFSGSLNNKVSSRSHVVDAAAGTLSAEVTFKKARSVTLTVRDGDGAVVASASGGSPVRVSSLVPAGRYSVEVSSAERVSYSLTVTTGG